MTLQNQSSAIIDNQNIGGKIRNDTDDTEDRECAVCLQSCLQPVRLSCNHIFCFLCIKGVTINHSQTKCPICRGNISKEDLTNPCVIPVSNKCLKRELSDEGETKYKWFYSGVSNGWWKYDQRTTSDIDKAYELFTSSKKDASKPKKKRRKKASKDGDDIDEKLCLKSTSSNEIMIAGVVYIIDFINMIQYRKGNPKKKRQIKRELEDVVVDCKGVAGLKKKKQESNEDEKFDLAGKDDSKNICDIEKQEGTSDLQSPKLNETLL